MSLSRPEKQLECPASMLPYIQSILDGEYDVPYQAPKPIILDIGANVGGFTAWALGKWPDAKIHCYEPLPSNFEFLKRNLGDIEAVTLNNIALGDPDRTKLLLGCNNCGEASLYNIGEQREEWIDVETMDPSILPKANIVKIDTEGSEIDILTRMPSIDFDIVLVEYHSDANRRKIDALLIDYYLIGGRIRSFRGVLKFARKRLFNETIHGHMRAYR